MDRGVESLRVLGIETSGRIGSVALLEARGSQLADVLERFTPEGHRTAQSLIPTIQDLLRERTWRPTEVELVCVTSGPGSFTGLRIGVVAAKTFAYATGAKLVGVHTLAAMAAGVETDAQRLWTVLDAQREELFTASFASSESLADRPSPPTQILGVDDWLTGLQPGDAVAGPPLARLRERLPSGVVVADVSECQPTAAAVGTLGVQLFDRGIQTNALELVPHYYRKSAAEEKAANARPST